MNRRNALQWQVFYRLGYCLSGLGMLGSVITYGQAIANAQTAVPVSRKANRSDGRHVPLSLAPQGNIASPESIVKPEVKPQSAALEVPAAVVAAPAVTAADTAVTTADTPLEASRRAADLRPAAAIAPMPNSATVVAIPETVETSEPSLCPTAITPGKPFDPTCKNATEASPAPIVPSLAKAPAAIAKSAVQQITQQINAQSKAIIGTKPAAPEAKADQPAAKININAQRVMTKPTTAPIRVGPISLSSAGISLNATAVNPYFNPQLRLPQIPGLEQLRMVFPIAVPAPITSSFGWRIHPISGTQRFHTGTDIGAPMGTPVMAAMSGRVILADNMGGYGISVAIEHDNGIRQTLYAHMSEIFVRPGDIVQQGTVIGRVGSTGASTGPHLHFELRQMLPDGTWVAQDVGQHLGYAMAQLVQSLQLAQSPQRSISQVLSPLRNVSPAMR